jgi:hypothetical protein
MGGRQTWRLDRSAQVRHHLPSPKTRPRSHLNTPPVQSPGAPPRALAAMASPLLLVRLAAAWAVMTAPGLADAARLGGSGGKPAEWPTGKDMEDAVLLDTSTQHSRLGHQGTQLCSPGPH